MAMINSPHAPMRKKVLELRRPPPLDCLDDN